MAVSPGSACWVALPSEVGLKVTVAELDAMPAAEASALLLECCGASRWVSEMIKRRPFKNREALLSVAGEIWQSLDTDDWLEAFSHHPRIGERSSAQPQTGRGNGWAAGEQSGMQGSGDEVRQALATANRQYEQRFGYIYIVCATGKSAEDMLAFARERLRNDPGTELLIAADEQRKITRLRLDKLLVN